MKKFVLLISALLLTITFSYSQTHIPAGDVSGIWTVASAPYIIDGEITIDTLDQLTIEPGVNVEFSGHYKFIVHGRLLAEGTEADSINFYPQDTTTGWHGLKFIYKDLNGQDSSKLDYCTFKYGKAFAGATLSDTCGGAIFCDHSSLLSIQNCLVERNKAHMGGGIFMNYSNIVMNYLVVKNNVTNGSFNQGGGIAARHNDVCIKNSQIFNNIGDWNGGGIYLDAEMGNQIYLKNVEIFNNTAGSWGGGIRTRGSTVDIFFQDVNIYNNNAGVGGGIYGSFYSVYCENVNIYGNNAFSGGGIFHTGSDGYLSNMKVYGNTATSVGGIEICADNCILESILIYGNTASSTSGIHVSSANDVKLNNVTVTGNDANPTGVMALLFGSSVELSNCIFWDNSTDDIYVGDGSTLTVNYSLIAGGYPGTGNVDMDPLFNDPATNDYSLTWDHFPEPDSTKSPCIDTGDPAIPYDPDGTRIDMGAIPYEQTYTALTAGDINGTLFCSESPYYVYGNLTIPDGDQLVIEPCVYMVFQGQYYLKVQGQLLAQGTESDKITFYAADSASGWSGVRFYGTSSNGQDSSKLENCRIFYGNVNTDGGGLFLNSSSDVLIKDCHIFKNRAGDQGGGVYLYGSAPLLINNTIEDNYGKYGGAIYGYVGNYKVYGGVIQDNTSTIGGGIYQRGSSPQFHGVTIKSNYATRVGGGIYFYGNCSPVFYPADRCNLFDNYAVAAGTDLYGNFIAGAHPNIYVDTFTVITPDKHFIYPFSEFTVDILNGKNLQVAGDLYVSPTGDNSNSGTSAAEPLQTIYQALKIILPDPAIERTIYLEPGTYSNGGTNENFPLNMRTDVTLNGGNKELTIFEGDSATNFFYFFDDQDCRLKNLTFHGGTAHSGGALNLDYDSTPEIDSVKFVYNSASYQGGAIFCDEYSDPLISNASFSANQAESNGGAIACKIGSSPAINNCYFYNNTGYNGGGLYAKGDAHVSLTNVIFDNNSGRDGGGCWIDYDSDPVLTNVSFINNEATYGCGGGAAFSYYSDPVMNNCLFSNNTASHGGGGFSIGSFCLLELNNSLITGNIAGFGGGVNGSSNSELILRNVEITNNTTQNTPYVTEEGGGLYLSDVNVSLINVTISDNLTATDGGAIYCRLGSNISIHNGILWNNIPDEINIESGNVTAEYSDIEGGWPGTGNLDVNPEFNDLFTFDYSLHELSPCIDMGTPDTTGLNLPLTDLAGNVRISNSRIDMGAYEFQQGVLQTIVDLKAFLEGPFNGTDMNTIVNSSGFLPLAQPYN
ncbi:MAG: right-handed parallel beta-helix repeat-containing protein, partial [Bacteroidales bacterium]|nr:right-handed parallel beta-helix repeat-containing protein [Bacteroidales bacterium]